METLDLKAIVSVLGERPFPMNMNFKQYQEAKDKLANESGDLNWSTLFLLVVLLGKNLESRFLAIDSGEQTFDLLFAAVENTQNLLEVQLLPGLRDFLRFFTDSLEPLVVLQHVLLLLF